MEALLSFGFFSYHIVKALYTHENDILSFWNIYQKWKGKFGAIESYMYAK